MNFMDRPLKQKRDNRRTIRAVSIDLNGVLENNHLDKLDEKTRSQLGLAIFKEFCNHSSVHGVRYFAEPRRHCIERIWWIIAVALSTGLCIFAIYNIWLRWQVRPVIVSFDDKSTPISTIPFPAITVCPASKFIKEKIDTQLFDNVLSEMASNKSAYKGVSPEVIHRLDAIQQICDKEISKLADDLIIPRTESIHKTIKDISPGYDMTVLFPTFMGQLVRLWPIFTGDGLCYTFNSLKSREIYTDDVDPELLTVEVPKNATHWNMENGYDSNVKENEIYPYRVFDCSWKDGLVLLVGIVTDDSQIYCSSLAPGWRASLHNPSEIPRIPDDFLFIPIEQEIYISVRPNVITTSEGLRHYSPMKRGCFFEFERQLRFFKTYDQRNCELECIANYTHKACGCVQFFMPRTEGTKVCTIVDNKCYVSAADEFSKKLLVKKCDCLPDCTSITYQVEISQAQKYYSAKDIALKNALNESSQQMSSSIFVSFKEHHFISINRTESTTFADFVASCGGLLGLFMGISMLSVIELIYFFTLRLICKWRQQKPLPTKVFIYNKRSDLDALKKQLERRRF